MKNFKLIIFILFLFYNCVSRQPEKILSQYPTNNHTQLPITAKDTILWREPSISPDCPYQTGFVLEIQNTNLNEVWECISNDIDNRLFLKDTIYSDNQMGYARTHYMNMKGILEIPKNHILKLAIEAIVEKKHELIFIKIRFSPVQARIKDSNWTCNLPDTLRDQILGYLQKWQQELLLRKWRLNK